MPVSKKCIILCMGVCLWKSQVHVWILKTTDLTGIEAWLAEAGGGGGEPRGDAERLALRVKPQLDVRKKLSSAIGHKEDQNPVFDCALQNFKIPRTGYVLNIKETVGCG